MLPKYWGVSGLTKRKDGVFPSSLPLWLISDLLRPSFSFGKREQSTLSWIISGDG